MDTKRKHIELRTLAGKAGKELYRRAQLVNEVLRDNAYVAEQWEDEAKALDFLSAECFPDLNGYVPLGRIRQIYDAFPSESAWKKHKYVLSAMEAAWRETNAEKAEERGFRTSWKKIAEERGEELEQAKARMQRTSRSENEALLEVDKLRARIRELEHENAVLSGRISELERVLSGNGKVLATA